VHEAIRVEVEGIWRKCPWRKSGDSKGEVLLKTLNNNSDQLQKNREEG